MSSRHHPLRASLRIVTTVWTALVALSAYAGAVGLIGGGISFGDEIDERLPFDSLALAGLALLLFVALPATVAAAATWRQGPRAPDQVAGAAIFLVFWIGLELSFIQTYSWMHSAFLFIAVVTLLLARAMRRTPPLPPRHVARRLMVRAGEPV
ncbi:hypothetical protein [Nocardioides ferulae]|uniref:hypothetical protein n=1 Tax=Nocardioides ferulae TaxID=2340821 RepID=UPI000EAE3A60|nr:hypothetical protein [Nocardioides ferulae]